MKKYFVTPEQVHLELPSNLVLAIEYVNDQLRKHNFKFKPPYTVSRHGDQIRALMTESGWLLTIVPEQDWEIRPLV